MPLCVKGFNEFWLFLSKGKSEIQIQHIELAYD